MVRYAALATLLILGVWPVACAPAHEPRECTMDGLASFFEAREAAWDGVITRLTKDTACPEVEGPAAPPLLETWLTDSRRLEALVAMGIDSVYRRAVGNRPTLFIEVCRAPGTDSVAAFGYAIRLDSSAGAQDPLPRTVNEGAGSSTSPAYTFRHLKGGVHIFAISAGRPDR